MWWLKAVPRLAGNIAGLHVADDIRLVECRSAAIGVFRGECLGVEVTE